MTLANRIWKAAGVLAIVLLAGWLVLVAVRLSCTHELERTVAISPSGDCHVIGRHSATGAWDRGVVDYYLSSKGSLAPRPFLSVYSSRQSEFKFVDNDILQVRLKGHVRIREFNDLAKVPGSGREIRLFLSAD
jgi:hypothetical protein